MKISENNSFWVSFSGLILGLFFIFLFIFCAFSAKFVLLKGDLNELILAQNEQNSTLENKKTKLNEQEKALFATIDEVSKDANISVLLHEKLRQIDENGTFITTSKVNEQIRILENKIKEMEQKDANTTKNLANDANKESTANNAEITTANSSENPSRNSQNSTNALAAQIALKAVAKLKIRLRDENVVDLKTGFVTLNTQDFFEPGTSALKASSKERLAKILNIYFDTMLADDMINGISHITLGVYTDNRGNYIANVNLAHKRSAELLSYIFSFYKNDEIKKYLAFMPLGPLDPVLKDGNADSTASRRIVLGFSTK